MFYFSTINSFLYNKYLYLFFKDDFLLSTAMESWFYLVSGERGNWGNSVLDSLFADVVKELIFTEETCERVQ